MDSAGCLCECVCVVYVLCVCETKITKEEVMILRESTGGIGIKAKKVEIIYSANV